MSYQQWKIKSIANQDNFSNNLKDRVWDKYVYPEEKEHLRKNIAFSVLGNPRQTGNDLGYTESERNLVDELYEKCITYSLKHFKDVYVAFIFTCVGGKLDTVVPVIRVRRDDSEDVRNAYFIDHTGRVYDSWQHYLNENIWDCCWICVPQNGKYTSENNAIIYDQSERGKVLEVIDKVSSATNIVAGLTAVAGIGMTFFPPTAPFGVATILGSTVVGAPGAVYGTGRSVAKLVDRAQHDQTIDPFISGEARACWLTAAASLLSVGTMGSTKLLTHTAKTGHLVSSSTRAFCTALNISSVSIHGLGVINGFVEVIQKDEVTSLDVLQLTTSIFFFTHSCVTFKTASGIIKEAQQIKINELRVNLSSEDAKIYDHMLTTSREIIEPGKTRTMHGNAKFIKEMIHIDNKSEFFQHFKIMSDGQFNIDNELEIHPKAFLQMPEEHRSTLLKVSKDFSEKKLTFDELSRNIALISKQYRIKFNAERELARTNLCKAFKVGNLDNVKINGKNILRDMKYHEVDRLDQVLQQACKNYNEKCIKLGIDFAERLGCQNVAEFCAATEYAVRQVDARVLELRAENPNPPRTQGVKAKDHYNNIAFGECIGNSQRLDEMSQSFNNLREKCDISNSAGNPKFGNSMAAANHYDKHGRFPKVDPLNNLPPERYFEIAREMTSGPIENPKWAQDGAILSCQFYSEEYGAMAIRYDNLQDKKSVIATLMKMDKIPVSLKAYTRNK